MVQHGRIIAPFQPKRASDFPYSVPKIASGEFDSIPTWATDAADLSGGAKLLLIQLCRFDRPRQPDLQRKGVVDPSIRTLADLCGTTQRLTRARLAELCRKRYIESVVAGRERVSEVFRICYGADAFGVADDSASAAPSAAPTAASSATPVVSHLLPLGQRKQTNATETIKNVTTGAAGAGSDEASMVDAHVDLGDDAGHVVSPIDEETPSNVACYPSGSSDAERQQLVEDWVRLCTANDDKFSSCPDALYGEVMRRVLALKGRA